MLSNDKFMPERGYMGIHLAPRYPHTHAKPNQFVPNKLKGVDVVVYKSISLLGLLALLCTVSATNLPLHGILHQLDQIEAKTPNQLPPSSVVNGLSTFEAGFAYDEDTLADEEQAEQRLADLGDGTPDSDSTFGSARDVPEHLQEWKARFEDWKNVHCINKAQHEVLSAAFLAYGNQAEWKVQYLSAAIVVKIPNLSRRKGKKEMPLALD